MTAWRVEGTLREFAKFKPVNMYFKYPIHEVDDVGVLADIQLEEEKAPWQKAKDSRKKNAKEQRTQQLNEFEIAFSDLEMDGEVLLSDLADALDTSQKTIGLWFGDGKKARTEYKKRYETYTGEDGQRYLRRKEDECAQP